MRGSISKLVNSRKPSIFSFNINNLNNDNKK